MTRSPMFLLLYLSPDKAVSCGTARVGQIRLPLTDEDVATIRDRGLGEAAAIFLVDPTHPEVFGAAEDAPLTGFPMVIVDEPTLGGALATLEVRRATIARLRDVVAMAGSPSWVTAQVLSSLHAECRDQLCMVMPPPDLRARAGSPANSTLAFELARWAKFFVDLATEEILAVRSRAVALAGDLSPRLRELVMASGGIEAWLPEDTAEREARARAQRDEEEGRRAARDAAHRAAVDEADKVRRNAEVDLVGTIGTPNQLDRLVAGVLPQAELRDLAETEAFSGFSPRCQLSGDDAIRILANGSVEEQGLLSEVNLGQEIDGRTWHLTAEVRRLVSKEQEASHPREGRFRIESYWVVRGRLGNARGVVVSARTVLATYALRQFAWRDDC